MPLGKLCFASAKPKLTSRMNNDQISKDLGKTEKKTKGALGEADRRRYRRGGKGRCPGRCGRCCGRGAGAVGALVVKYTALNNELKTAAARTGMAKDELHVLRNVAEKLGSEDGLEGVTDSAQELSLRLQEVTKDGFRTDEALHQIGLTSEDLRTKTPTEALYAVIEGLQGIENQQQKNWLADELMGGSVGAYRRRPERTTQEEFIDMVDVQFDVHKLLWEWS